MVMSAVEETARAVETTSMAAGKAVKGAAPIATKEAKRAANAAKKVAAKAAAAASEVAGTAHRVWDEEAAAAAKVERRFDGDEGPFTREEFFDVRREEARRVAKTITQRPSPTKISLHYTCLLMRFSHSKGVR